MSQQDVVISLRVNDEIFGCMCELVQDVAAHNMIEAMPTFLFFKDGQMVTIQ